jgi:FKBP-type peptidyl-prolyl cis-trans isomerase SlyD
MSRRALVSEQRAFVSEQRALVSEQRVIVAKQRVIGDHGELSLRRPQRTPRSADLALAQTRCDRTPRREQVMQIAKHMVVSIDYTLKNDAGDVIDTSQGASPLTYLHGVGSIIPGLEQALEGKSSGAQFEVSIDPAEAYGQRREDLQQVVSRERLGEIDDLQVGMHLRATADSGDPLVMTVVEVGESTVTVDGNHQLAGDTLHFDVTIREVRDATSEEIKQGNV